jgi:hypothetical protein
VTGLLLARERPHRRRRQNVIAQHLPGASGAHEIAVIDAVGAKRHRRHQGHHLRARIRRAWPLAEIDGLIDQRRPASARNSRLSRGCS